MTTLYPPQPQVPGAARPTSASFPSSTPYSAAAGLDLSPQVPFRSDAQPAFSHLFTQQHACQPHQRLGQEEEAVHSSLLQLEQTCCGMIDSISSCEPDNHLALSARDREAQGSLANMRASIRDLELLADEQDTMEQTKAVHACLKMHKAEYERLRKALADAKVGLAKKQEAAFQQARKELLSGASIVELQQKYKTQADLVAGAADITDSLRRTRQLMQQQLEQTEGTLAVLDASSRTLEHADKEFTDHKDLHKKSHKLLNTLHKQSVWDRISLYLGLLFFLSVCAYIGYKRAPAPIKAPISLALNVASYPVRQAWQQLRQQKQPVLHDPISVTNYKTTQQQGQHPTGIPDLDPSLYNAKQDASGISWERRQKTAASAPGASHPVQPSYPDNAPSSSGRHFESGPPDASTADAHSTVAVPTTAPDAAHLHTQLPGTVGDLQSSYGLNLQPAATVNQSEPTAPGTEPADDVTHDNQTKQLDDMKSPSSGSEVDHEISPSESEELVGDDIQADIDYKPEYGSIDNSLQQQQPDSELPLHDEAQLLAEPESDITVEVDADYTELYMASEYDNTGSAAMPGIESDQERLEELPDDDAKEQKDASTADAEQEQIEVVMMADEQEQPDGISADWEHMHADDSMADAAQEQPVDSATDAEQEQSANTSVDADEWHLADVHASDVEDAELAYDLQPDAEVLIDEELTSEPWQPSSDDSDLQLDASGGAADSTLEPEYTEHEFTEQMKQPEESNYMPALYTDNISQDDAWHDNDTTDAHAASGLGDDSTADDDGTGSFRLQQTGSDTTAQTDKEHSVITQYQAEYDSGLASEVYYGDDMYDMDPSDTPASDTERSQHDPVLSTYMYEDYYEAATPDAAVETAAVPSIPAHDRSNQLKSAGQDSEHATALHGLHAEPAEDQVDGVDMLQHSAHISPDEAAKPHAAAAAVPTRDADDAQQGFELQEAASRSDYDAAQLLVDDEYAYAPDFVDSQDMGGVEDVELEATSGVISADHDDTTAGSSRIVDEAADELFNGTDDDLILDDLNIDDKPAASSEHDGTDRGDNLGTVGDQPSSIQNQQSIRELARHTPSWRLTLPDGADDSDYAYDDQPPETAAASTHQHVHVSQQQHTGSGSQNTSRAVSAEGSHDDGTCMASEGTDPKPGDGRCVNPDAEKTAAPTTATAPKLSTEDADVADDTGLDDPDAREDTADEAEGILFSDLEVLLTEEEDHTAQIATPVSVPEDAAGVHGNFAVEKPQLRKLAADKDQFQVDGDTDDMQMNEASGAVQEEMPFVNSSFQESSTTDPDESTADDAFAVVNSESHGLPDIVNIQEQAVDTEPAAGSADTSTEVYLDVADEVVGTSARYIDAIMDDDASTDHEFYVDDIMQSVDAVGQDAHTVQMPDSSEAGASNNDPGFYSKQTTAGTSNPTSCGEGEGCMAQDSVVPDSTQSGTPGAYEDDDLDLIVQNIGHGYEGYDYN